ncbi:MAG: DUF61 family protein [Candidatus Thorarchaeota archaeon]|nr:DUF61 family protein [Candidatus Thorarchaeota archaeon]
MSSKIDKMLEHDIDTLNDHLPHARINLAVLLKQEDPHFITRSGEKSVFKVEELEWLRKDIPTQFHDSIRLPIILLRRLDYGPGIHSVGGNKTELFMIHKVLGYDDLEWDNFASWKPVEQLSRPQVQILRRKMPSTTSLGIVLTTSKDTKKSDSLKN